MRLDPNFYVAHPRATAFAPSPANGYGSLRQRLLTKRYLLATGPDLSASTIPLMQ
jgi:hypothetical protein